MNKAFDKSKYALWIDPNKVYPYERNAKQHDEKQIKNIANSIRRFGWQQDTVITSDNVLVIGHGRRLAALKLGCEMPYHVIDKTADELTDEDIRELRIADNQTNAETGFDFEMLDAEISDLDFAGFDFDFSVDEQEQEQEEEAAEVVEDDYDEDNLPDEPKAKLGDIYQLGRHRLMCGDSTDAESVKMLMDGARADLLLTDPPYGISIQHKDGRIGSEKKADSKGKRVTGANIYHSFENDDTIETARASYDVALVYSDNQIIFGGNYFTEFLPQSDAWLIWDKRCQDNMRNNFADGEMAWCSFHTPVRIYHQLWNGMIREGEHEKRVHPTQKPVGMLANILKDFSEENDSVLDCFGGSGSTLIACEQLNRTCYMMELDPHYVDVIIDRWEKFTGEKAVLLNGE